MSFDPVWAPVIAALGASLLTVLGTVGRDRLQERREGRGAEKKEQLAAYQEVLNRSLAFANRSRALGETMRLRSGLEEGLSVALRQRRLLDPFELYDWIDKDYGPLIDAWSRVWVVGPQSAIDAADRVALACGEVLGAATARSYRNQVVRAYRMLVGEVWTRDQLAEYDRALRRLAEERVAFVKVIRAEMGKQAVDLALERADQQAREPPKQDHAAT
jgi:hypothetical protein